MSYRSDRDALETRREALETDLRALRERAGELTDVEARIRETLAAIDELNRRMEAPEPVRRLPLIDLDQLRIASPCTAEWEKMQGDERVRFCGDCKLHVFNLSAMTRAEATSLLEERTGRTCVRFFRRHDGTVLTTDCPVGARKKRVRRAVLAVAGASAVAIASVATLVGLRARRETCSMRRPNSAYVMGDEAPATIRTTTPMGQPEREIPMMGEPAMPPEQPVVRPTRHSVMQGGVRPPRRDVSADARGRQSNAGIGHTAREIIGR